MISQYDGKCTYCGKPTKANVDTYDTRIRKSYHQKCHDNQPTDLFSANEAEQLAKQLGFIGPDEPIPEAWFQGRPVSERSH